MIFCFISVKIKKSRNDSWTITSVYQFPLLINFKDCYIWPNRLWVEYHVIHVLYGSKFRRPSLSIFWKYFHEILKSEETLLTYYRWYDWLTEGREIRSDRKWLSYYQPMAAIFLKKKEFYQFKMSFWSFLA